MTHSVTAVFPGTFDPITNGHVDIIRRSLRVFPRITVAVAYNPNKESSMFTPEEKVKMIREALDDVADQIVVDATAEAGDVGELVEAIVDRTGYRAELEASRDPQDGARLDNLNELVAVARDFSATAAEEAAQAPVVDDDEVDGEGEPEPGSLAAFLEGVSLVADADQVPDSEAGVVTLMTLHAALLYQPCGNMGTRHPFGTTIGKRQHFRPRIGTVQMGSKLSANLLGTLRPNLLLIH